MTITPMLRGATAADLPFLERMLAFAASMDASAQSLAQVRTDPVLTPYLEGWPRAGDLGIVAERDHDPIGAAWLRLAPPLSRPGPTKLWDREIPELAIATIPELRGEGVGGAMLRELIARARGTYPAIVLSVRAESPAVRLYERCGFVTVRELVNRVGTRSLAMRLEL